VHISAGLLGDTTDICDVRLTVHADAECRWRREQYRLGRHITPESSAEVMAKSAAVNVVHNVSEQKSRAWGKLSAVAGHHSFF